MPVITKNLLKLMALRIGDHAVSLQDAASQLESSCAVGSAARARRAGPHGAFLPYCSPKPWRTQCTCSLPGCLLAALEGLSSRAAGRALAWQPATSSTCESF